MLSMIYFPSGHGDGQTTTPFGLRTKPATLNQKHTLMSFTNKKHRFAVPNKTPRLSELESSKRIDNMVSFLTTLFSWYQHILWL